MKRRILVLLCMMLSGLFVTRTGAAQCAGIWNISFENLSQSDVILSKLCALELEVQNEFDATFTLINQAISKACTVSSKVDVLDIDHLLSINDQCITIVSKVEVIDQNVEQIIVDIDIIHTDDFGGTWTALEGLEQTLCDKFEMAFSVIDYAESKLDQLSVIQQSHFTDTFTLLQIVGNDVLDTLIELNSLSELLIMDLSEVDVCIMTAIDLMETVESKIDALDLEVETQFDNTFTVIDALLQEVCTVQSKLDYLDITIQENQLATFTALFVVIEKQCTVESKVEVTEIIVEHLGSLVDKVLVDVQEVDSKADVISSKFDQIEEEMMVVVDTTETIESKATALESSINFVNTDGIIGKICTIISRIDVINPLNQSLESKVDILDSDLIIIDSKVDVVGIKVLEILDKACTVDSRVDIVEAHIVTAASKIDILDTLHTTLNSKIDIINEELTSSTSKLCVIDSTLDVIDTTLAADNSILIIVDSTVDVISSKIDDISAHLGSLEDVLPTIESKADALGAPVAMLLDKVCTIESHVDVIDSKADILLIDSSTGDVLAAGLNQDMNETWTILAFIDSKMDALEDRALTVASELDIIAQPSILDIIIVIVDEAAEKSCTILDTLLTLESKLDVFDNTCQVSFASTFTAINASIQRVCTLESKVDVLTFDIQDIIDYGGVAVGTPLTLASFSDTFSIIESGRYFLADDIDFTPGANSAMYIDADDVHIDFCGHYLNQTNGNTARDGIQVALNRCNISIENGIIRNFTASGIELLGGNSFIRITNMAMINNGADQILINSTRVDEGASNIIIRNVIIDGAGADCINVNNGSGIFIAGCETSGTTADGGMHINACDYLCIDGCIARSNSTYGLAGAAIAANSDQQFGMTNFVVNGLIAEANVDGIRLIGFNKNGVIKECVLNGNTDGIRIATQTNQVQDSRNICAVHNVCSNNTSNGIQIDGDGSNNYFAFNSMHENTSTNFLEDTGEGPNSVLGNYAFKSSGTNYTGGNTVINASTISQSAAFPATEPTYWVNANVTP